MKSGVHWDDAGTFPLLSIIITCYNYENYVQTAIESILDQRVDFIELIVIDDGSTDGSWDRINQYGNSLTAVRLQNGGALKASLHGLEMSSGRFVYFLDADDFLKPGSLDVIRGHLGDGVSKIQFRLAPVNHAGTVVGPDFPKLDSRHSSEDLRRLIALRGSYLTPPTSGNVYRRDVYQELGDLSYERGIDGVSYLLAPFVGEVVSLDVSLGCYRIHNQNLTSFTNVSASRVEWSAERFLRRLEHLRTLLAEKSIEWMGFRSDRQFAYVVESEILSLSLRNQVVPFETFRRYARSIYAEEISPKREMFVAMYMLLALAPHRVANELILFRINQTRYPRIRRILKTLTQIR